MADPKRLALAALLVVPVMLYAVLIVLPQVLLRWIDPDGSFVWERRDS